MKVASSAISTLYNLFRLLCLLLISFMIPLAVCASPERESGGTLDPQLQAEAQLADILEAKSVQPNQDRVLRILAIGNSFSEDAIENYLHELAAEAGIKMIIGNMYIGGASLDLHWK